MSAATATQVTEDSREKMLLKRQQLLQSYYDTMQKQVKQSQKDLARAIQERQQYETELDKVLNHNNELKSNLKTVQSTLYEATKPIRVTDDDFSTIIANLGKFSGKINNFAPNVKSAFLRKGEPDFVKQFFCKLFPGEATVIGSLFDSQATQTDFMLVSVLLERYLTEVLVDRVLKTGIHLDDVTNESFARLETLFLDTQHEEWAKDLRLRTAKATAELIQKKDPAALAAIEKTKEEIVADITTTLSPILDITEDVKQRIERLVDMASDLCLPIHGQDEVLVIHPLNTGDAIMPNQVKQAYRHINENSDSIYLGITPVFLAKSVAEGEEEVSSDTFIKNYTLVYPGKAIW